MKKTLRTTNRRTPHRLPANKRYKTIYIPRKAVTLNDVAKELDKRGISYEWGHDNGFGGSRIPDFYWINVKEGTYIVNGRILYDANISYNVCVSTWYDKFGYRPKDEVTLHLHDAKYVLKINVISIHGYKRKSCKWEDKVDYSYSLPFPCYGGGDTYALSTYPNRI